MNAKKSEPIIESIEFVVDSCKKQNASQSCNSKNILSVKVSVF